MDIKEYRKKHGLSVIQVSKSLEVSRQHITDIEQGRAFPSRKLAKKIIEWSNNEITCDDLLLRED